MNRVGFEPTQPSLRPSALPFKLPIHIKFAVRVQGERDDLSTSSMGRTAQWPIDLLNDLRADYLITCMWSGFLLIFLRLPRIPKFSQVHPGLLVGIEGIEPPLLHS